MSRCFYGIIGARSPYDVSRREDGHSGMYIFQLLFVRVKIVPFIPQKCFEANNIFCSRFKSYLAFLKVIFILVFIGGRSLVRGDSSQTAQDDFFFGNPTSSVGPIAGGIVGCFVFLVRSY